MLVARLTLLVMNVEAEYPFNNPKIKWYFLTQSNHILLHNQENNWVISSLFNIISGCHCTPIKFSLSLISIASVMPSCAVAVTTTFFPKTLIH